MADNFNSIQVDDLLQQLRDTPKDFIVKPEDGAATSDLPPVSSEPVKEEDLGDYVIKKTTALVDHTMSAFKDIKEMAVATNDPDTILALSNLINSVTGSLETLNKIHIQNKKAQTSKEIAHINAEARKKQAENQPAQTNVLAVGTREEVIRLLNQAAKKTNDSPIIDAEVTPSQ